MLQTQVNYWNLIEQKRHNLETEKQGRESNLINRFSADSGRMQAEASLQTSSANLQNADTNRWNAAINERNAEINARNAESNARNAESNARNASTNAWNASINEQNMKTNVVKAKTEQFNAETNRLDYQRKMQETLFNTEGEGLELERRKTGAQETSAQGTYTRGQASMLETVDKSNSNLYKYQAENYKSSSEQSLAQADLARAQKGKVAAETWETWVDTAQAGYSLGKEVAGDVKNILKVGKEVKAAKDFISLWQIAAP